VISYHWQWYSSAVASGGEGIGCRSACEGLRSIISRWSCSVSSAVSLETPAGSGVIVVKFVRFDMAFVLAMGQSHFARSRLEKLRKCDSESDVHADHIALGRLGDC